ncbi:Cupin 2 conserved barrel domain protein [Thermodesulfatator indicus DSM 15286]|uniref:Cupin 2 conserved barrel domain protein n=1 Tax=Thermodesulfatator indicus (strain DSM 15286 / JCM 11887 / CIR29812) TaxID=667014 RepID=F8A8X3_THEID|nr:cupin domain-containing protein [Thermodesulfatator indicus]AEH44020.1 Cupin 2 conserved barrel domain protein [Thermodesulfatator indicus DSM 15286]
MKVFNLDETRVFDKALNKFLVHDSPYFRIINFNIKAGEEFPVHSHSVEGELSILVLEGEGYFLGAEGAKTPAKAGDIFICAINEPHGVEAKTDMRILVAIAPPL